MNIILLAGNSLSNKKWILDVEKRVGHLFSQSVVQDYDHWKTGKEFIDLEKELQVLEKTVAGMNEYVVFAKSVGTLVTLKGIHEKRINPKRCIFLGLSLEFVKQTGDPLHIWIKNNSVPTIFVQKNADPIGRFADMKILVEQSGVSNYRLIEVKGDNHQYDDLDMLEGLVTEFFLS